MQTRIIGMGLVLGLLGITACVTEERDGFGDGAGQDDDTSDESPSGEGIWLGNGLQDPDVSGIDPLHGLSTEEGLPDALLADEQGQELTEYLVECALPEGEEITKLVDGEPMAFAGLLGLAPQWQDGACDEDCQQWVSACLLARTNATGQSVWIWLTGDHDRVGLGRSSAFPLHEATFYGNLFADPPQRFVCRGSLAGQQMAYLDGRTCAEGDMSACGFTTFGQCHIEERCTMQGGIPTDCRAGRPATGGGYRSLSTFVDIPAGWHGWGG